MKFYLPIYLFNREIDQLLTNIRSKKARGVEFYPEMRYAGELYKYFANTSKYLRRYSKEKFCTPIEVIQKKFSCFILLGMYWNLRLKI